MLFFAIGSLVMVKNRVCNDCTRCPEERVQVRMIRPRRTRGRTRQFVCLPRPLRRHGTDGSQLDEAAVLLHDLTVSHMTSRETVLVFVRQTVRDSFCPLTTCVMPSRSWMLLGFGRMHRKSESKVWQE